MRMNDIVTLVNGEIKKDAEGYPALSIASECEVFASVSSPKRAQRDSALRHDYVATLTVTIYREEYNDEQYIRFGKRMYEVKQSYILNADEIELTCSDARC